MITDVASHYRNLLAEHYTWSLGDPHEVLERTRELFAEMELMPRSNGLALDLGCGPGTQAIPLAELGFTVQAVDSDEGMLEELNQRKGGHLIQTVEADMRDYVQQMADAPELISCMGDSLTLLSDLDDVALFLFTLYKKLCDGGRLALSFRDQTEALKGEDKIFMLRSEPNRIMSCALDYEEEFLLVTDLLHVRDHNGWQLEKSTYRKCRLRGDWMLEQLEECGFEIDFWQSHKGQVALLAKK